MKRVYVNEEVCLGCHLCEFECAYANAGTPDATGKSNNMYKVFNRENAPVPRIRVEEGEPAGDDKITFAVSCRHCETPYCVLGCITGALSIEDGVIKIDDERCIGCRTCTVMCPYGCLVYSDHHTMLKCELCLENATGSPACVQGCPNRAIVYEERQS
ncbi:MAG: 4Fe-4S dicluster domain-containing protein [Eubacteriaceae bacterium]|jgi:carbon-monoxide dehydrogenase iron sulfur subunit